MDFLRHVVWVHPMLTFCAARLPLVTASEGLALLSEEVTGGAGLDFLKPIVGRGLAVGDFDNDGKMDALVVDSEGAPLLHNETRSADHWIGFRLVGTGRSNRDAYGAVVTVEAGGRHLMRVCHADGSYLSSSDKRVHIGIGKATSADQVTIRWPDGKIERLRHLKADCYVTLNETGKLGN